MSSLIARLGAVVILLAALAAPASAQTQIVGKPQDLGYESGAVAVAQTPGNASHAAGSAIGNLFTVTIARLTGGSGIVSNLLWKSTGGSTGALLLRIWQKDPVNTTCTDGQPFVGSDSDDASLITAPFVISPAVPAVTTGDAATYASLSNLVLDYKNADTPASANLYVCAVTVATDTVDANRIVRLTLSGPQN